jgi:hypothetical protein
MGRHQDPAVIRRVLGMQRVAVVGLSSNPMRPSNDVAHYLKRHGYHIIPVNPNETEVLGERAYPSLSAVPGGVDVVNVFRESAAVPDIAREAALIGARGLWLQLGVVSDEGVKIAEAAGMDVVEDRCIKTEHARYGD